MLLGVLLFLAKWGAVSLIGGAIVSRWFHSNDFETERFTFNEEQERV